MFEKYIERPQALARHQSAPLVRERARFLAYTESCGTGKQTIRIAAAYLLRIIELLSLSKLRDVTIEEVDQAASRWNELRNQENHYTGGMTGVRCFRLTAQRFLRFLGKLKCLPVQQPFSKYLNDFVHAMEREYGFAEATIRGRRYRAANFLTWYARRHRTLRDIRFTDVDAYTTRKPLEGGIPSRDAARRVRCERFFTTPKAAVGADTGSQGEFNRRASDANCLNRWGPRGEMCRDFSKQREVRSPMNCAPRHSYCSLRCMGCEEAKRRICS